MPFVCVFASSSRRLDPEYYAAATSFGAGAAHQGWDLVFGGANIGLMDAVARGFESGGARIVSVIPRIFDRAGLTWTRAAEVILTDDLRERKRAMDTRAGAFVALPGGPGTADELFEILTLKQVGLHERPILVLNQNGHWDPLLLQLERMHESGFCLQDPRELIQVETDVAGLLEALGRG
ncbi:MAG: TIGR00730 family Rossman fold protein [Planctomycetes bacterium]|nr:TIGR00730 family Rossman fold protein [Planctomycetota bacterium]